MLINSLSGLSISQKIATSCIGISALAYITKRISEKTFGIFLGLGVLAAAIGYCVPSSPAPIPSPPSLQNKQTSSPAVNPNPHSITSAPSSPAHIAPPQQPQNNQTSSPVANPNPFSITSATIPLPIADENPQIKALKANFISKVSTSLSVRQASLTTILRTVNSMKSMGSDPDEFFRQLDTKINDLHQKEYTEKTKKESGQKFEPFIDKEVANTALTCLEQVIREFQQSQIGQPQRKFMPTRHDHATYASTFLSNDKTAKEKANKEIFEQTVEAIRAGGFSLPNGEECMLSIPENENIFCHTHLLQPTTIYNTRIEISNQSTFVATKEFVEKGLRPLVLDMANKKRVCGDPDRANAQEETLGRQSTLYAGLSSVNGVANGTYPEGVTWTFQLGEGILVKGVQFFRNDPTQGYEFIKPFTADLFASAAFDCNKAHGEGYDRPGNDQEYISGVETRIRTIFYAAVHNRNDSLVLGAHGCGAFQNDPKVIAAAFKRVYDRQFKGVFKAVRFAILDRPNGENIQAFQRAFTTNS